MKRSSRSRFVSRRAQLLRAACPLFTVALLAGGPSAFAVTQTWDPGLSGTGATYGSGNWAAGAAPAIWSNGATDGTFTNGNAASFGGTPGVGVTSAAVTLTTAVTAASLNFDTAGYTIDASNFILTLGSGGITTTHATGTTTVNGTVNPNATQAWNVATGGTLTVGATYTSASATNYNLTLGGAGAYNFSGGSAATPSVVTGVLTAGGGGIVNVSGFLNTASTTAANTKFIVNGGTTLNWSGTGTQSGIYTGIADGSNGTLNVTAGSLTVSPGTALFIGNNAAGLLNVSGGLVTIGSNSAIYLGNGFNGGGGTGSGAITISGGQFTTGVTTGNFTLGSAGTNTGTGTVNLNGGILSTNRVFSKGASANGAATINFNGGTLQATGTALAIPTSITTNIAEGGATIDAQTFGVTLATNFTHGGTAATDGGLKITSSATSGAGAVTLNGILSQTGGLTVNSAAALAGNNTYTGATAINAFVDVRTSGNIFGATGAGNGTTINTGGTVRFRDFTTPLVSAEAFTFNGGTLYTYNDSGTSTLSGLLTLNAAATISVSPQAQASTTLVLSGGIVDGATTGNNVAFSRIGAAAANSNDVINVTGASTYGGATAITDALNANAGVFSVRVSGGDNRLPTTTTVTLGGTAGGGNAAGSGRLILGDATIGASNQTIAGLTTSGTGANNAVVGGATTVSTLIVNNTADFAYAGALGGAATNANNFALTKSGAGILTLTAANTYTGGTTIGGGTLITGNNTALGVGSVTINNNGRLNIGDVGGTATVATLALGANALTLNSGGTLVMTLTNTTSSDNITLSGVATLGGTLSLNNTNGINYANSYALITGASSLTMTGLTITGYNTTSYTASLSSSGVLSFTVVPEPSTYACVFAALGGFAAHAYTRRSRREA